MDKSKSSSTGEMKDVSDGDFLHSFLDFNGQPFQSSTTDNIGRYTFSLGLDFFNPLGNKQAGKKTSVGIISLVCLSLPEDLRYKTENMFLASIIPGPKEPPLDALNHYLTPLVDEFLTFWNPGVRFSRTLSHSMGRLVLCALVLVVCDLLAARKVGGFAACTHNRFCSVCHCTRKLKGKENAKVKNLNSTDYYGWKHRTNEECRLSADKFRQAATEKARQSAFDATGMRWSELLRLPYFDITRCVIVDSMHNLFLGLIKEHFNKILGIGLPLYAEGAVVVINFGAPPATFSPRDPAGLKKLKKMLEVPSALAFPTEEEAMTKLTSVSRKVLEFACKDLGLQIQPTSSTTKKEFAEVIYRWRQGQHEERELGADTSTGHGHVLVSQEMKEVWQDIDQMLTPSWITSLPDNLGSKSHGKLKADQWRTLGSVHLPISLIHLWGSVDISDSRSLRCRQILDVTMSLLSAVVIATSHSTSHEQAEAYLQHMLKYLNGIKELFPEYDLKPNHHMALHLCEFLVLFGPVHSWWTFPFERMIGCLQHMPHNFKPGEIEITMARAYTRSANLRSIVSRSTCPEVIRHSFSIFQRLVDLQVQNTLQKDLGILASIVDIDQEENSKSSPSTMTKSLFEELSLPFHHINVVIEEPYYSLPMIRIQGISFSTVSEHRGNAGIMVFQGNPIPAYISHIIQSVIDRKQMTFLAIRRLRPSPFHYDPYSAYPALQARMWDSNVGELEIIRLNDVVSHFACLPLQVHRKQVLVVVPLWRSITLDD